MKCIFLCFQQHHNLLIFFFFFNFYFYFILLYNTVLVLPYIDMNPPWVYMSSQSWTPLPPPTPYHLSGSSPCTSPKHPISCIEPRLAIRFLHDSIHVSKPFSGTRGRSSKMIWGGRWEGGFRIGNSCTPMADSCQCMAKLIQYCKAK